MELVTNTCIELLVPVGAVCYVPKKHTKYLVELVKPSLNCEKVYYSILGSAKYPNDMGGWKNISKQSKINQKLRGNILYLKEYRALETKRYKKTHS